MKKSLLEIKDSSIISKGLLYDNSETEVNSIYSISYDYENYAYLFFNLYNYRNVLKNISTYFDENFGLKPKVINRNMNSYLFKIHLIEKLALTKGFLDKKDLEKYIAVEYAYFVEGNYFIFIRNKNKGIRYILNKRADTYNKVEEQLLKLYGINDIEDIGWSF